MSIITNSSVLLIFLIIITLTPNVYGQRKEIQLSTLEIALIEQDILRPTVDQSMTGSELSISGVKYNRRISVHAPSKGHIYLGGNALKFRAQVGIDDINNRKINSPSQESLVNTNGTKTFFYLDSQTQKRKLIGVGSNINKIKNGSVKFSLEGDGSIVWESGLIKGGEAAVNVDVDISGIKMLSFSVTDGEDGISGDVGNWAEASITYLGSEPQIVDGDYLLRKGNREISDHLKSQISALPAYKESIATNDWLIQKPKIKAEVYRVGKRDIVLSNGLASRTFRIQPNTAATVSLKNLVTNEELIRSVQPEALLMIDSVKYNVGGMGGQIEHGYLLSKWLDDMFVLPNSFELLRFEIKDLKERMVWKKKRWISTTQWETKGKELIFHYGHSSPELSDMSVEVHYELFDNIPLFSKWIVVKSDGKGHKLNHFTSEIIAHFEAENYVDNPETWRRPNLYIENEYAFGGFTYTESDKSIEWESDPNYTSQVNYNRITPVILKSQPQFGPDFSLSVGSSFTSFRTFILLVDEADFERKTLALRKMYRTLAPWVTENPIFMHLTSTEPSVVKTAINQCAETGYEMVILSFGSGLNMEDNSSKNITKFKGLVDYAHSKGIELGGYSLFSSRSIGDETDVIDINTGEPGGAKFGNAPCMGSEWGLDYLDKLGTFFEKTGFDLLEHDGPYPGDFCASDNHPGHNGYYDSQYNQWDQSVTFYGWLREKGVYMNLPDFYFMSGSNKTGIGYREVNWSLPRAQQIILGRQNIYDGTWMRTPSMGWTFVPLTQYHGGGAAATLEPLSEHLKEYEAHMIQNYGSGVQACYRGPRLYDSEKTKQVVKNSIDHYKKYRDILNADIIHLRRPNGRDWDGILHVDPELEVKGYAQLYNPLSIKIKRKIKLPLYYTGITGEAKVSLRDMAFRTYTLDRNYNIELELEIPAEGSVWLTIE